MWAFDYTEFYYYITDNCLTNYIMDFIHDRFIYGFYDSNHILLQEDRDEFFEAFMNSEIYETCFPNPSTSAGMDYVIESFNDIGIDLEKYDLNNEEETVQLFNDFLKAVNFDFTKIDSLNK